MNLHISHQKMEVETYSESHFQTFNQEYCSEMEIVQTLDELRFMLVKLIEIKLFTDRKIISEFESELSKSSKKIGMQGGTVINRQYLIDSFADGSYVSELFQKEYGITYNAKCQPLNDAIYHERTELLKYFVFIEFDHVFANCSSSIKLVPNQTPEETKVTCKIIDILIPICGSTIQWSTCDCNEFNICSECSILRKAIFYGNNVILEHLEHKLYAGKDDMDVEIGRLMDVDKAEKRDRDDSRDTSEESEEPREFKRVKRVFEFEF